MFETETLPISQIKTKVKILLNNSIQLDTVDFDHMLNPNNTREVIDTTLRTLNRSTIQTIMNKIGGKIFDIELQEPNTWIQSYAKELNVLTQSEYMTECLVRQVNYSLYYYS